MADVGLVLPASVWGPALVLGYVAAQRLVELAIAGANTRRLKREGAIEVGAAHYPLIVALHACWLATLWLMAFGHGIHLVALFLLAVVQLLRLWTLVSIGRRWTTRILVVPGERLVARGPYRYVAHPNYVVVALEIALVPAVFGLYAVAAVFTILNAGILFIRIRAEEAALRRFTTGRRAEPRSDGLEDAP